MEAEARALALTLTIGAEHLLNNYVIQLKYSNITVTYPNRAVD